MEYTVRLTAGGGAAQPVVVVGLRGLGKTALLRRALRVSVPEAIVLYAEGSEYQTLAMSFRRGLERAAASLSGGPDRLRASLDGALRRLPKASFELPHDMGVVALEGRDVAESPKLLIDTIYELHDAAAKHGRFLLFAIDEIQTVSPEELVPVVQFVHETAGTETPAALLAAGLPNSREHLHRVKTYTERWRYLRLNLLSEDESRDAIAIPARERRVRIEDRALELLARESAGYPFFVQELGAAAWATRDGDAIAYERVRSIVPGVRRLIDESLYEPAIDRLTGPELAYAFALAALGPGPQRVGDIAASLGKTSASANWLRNQLIKKDVIYSPASGLVEFRLPLTEQFLSRNSRALATRLGISPMPSP
jgi:hypothetical protein